MIGKVKWFNVDKGFGFITSNDLDKDIFIHYSNINMLGRKDLFANQIVEFDLVDNNGNYSAKNLFVRGNDYEC